MSDHKSNPTHQRVTKPERKTGVHHSLLPPFPHLQLRAPFSDRPRGVWDPSRYLLVNAPTSLKIVIRASTKTLTDSNLSEVPALIAPAYLKYFDQAQILRLGTPTPPAPPPSPQPPQTATRHVYLMVQPTEQFVYHAPFTYRFPLGFHSLDTYIPSELDTVIPVGVNVQFHDDDKSGWEFTGVLQASVNSYLWNHRLHDPGDVPQAQTGYTVSGQAQMAYVVRLGDHGQAVFGVLAQPGAAIQWDPDSQGYRPNWALAVAGVAGLNYSFNDRLGLGAQIQAGPTIGSPLTFDMTAAVNLTWNFKDFPTLIKLGK